MDRFPENPNLNPNYTHLPEIAADPLSWDFELWEYLNMLDGGADQDSTSQQRIASSEKIMDASSAGSIGATSRNNDMQVKPLSYSFLEKIEIKVLVPNYHCYGEVFL